MAGFHAGRKEPSSSLNDRWREESSFRPPRIPSTAAGGIRRLRDTLSSKISRSAFAEREYLKKEARYKTPLTQRNMDAFTTQQEAAVLIYRDRSCYGTHSLAAEGLLRSIRCKVVLGRYGVSHLGSVFWSPYHCEIQSV
ncbi:hypothetical protein DTO169E5_4499 [Paecilomyces variotii]|nr:hypothetical protein DTO169E5_4499 [Paecilomyces variotii]KAJ9352821.1 hypothetical protein DTO027B9_5569 [Paecilomyces variotii]KAJ9410778.1 hypothetical protein DTO045G8_1684 [Paecilomyces variotii]